MRAVVAHAAKDLRVEKRPRPRSARGTSGCESPSAASAARTCITTHHGGFGDVRLREPMILGHEVAGVVEAVGAEVPRVRVGERVAVNPSRPCNHCRYCLEGQQNHCLDMRFYGSAMRFPTCRAASASTLVCDEAQAMPSPTASRSAKPRWPSRWRSACTPAPRRAPARQARAGHRSRADRGPLRDRRPARGRRRIVVTDIADATLGAARRVGADQTLNVAADPARLADYGRDKGHFDVLFEASGAEAAVRSALEVVRPGGVLVQLGLGGEMTLPVNMITAKELEMRGTFRFHEEFALAVELIGKGLVDVKPLITATIPFIRAREAFELAGDRSRSMKVQLQF